MTTIIDNMKERLADVLNSELSDLDEIAIASAYFNIRGYGAIADGLGDKPMMLLLGREPTESIKWEDEILREIEEFEDDSEYFRLLQKTTQYFKDGKRQVRTVEGRFFHGKAYIAASPSMREVRRGVGVVGSSNFTYGGLVSNRELNMLNTDREVVKELCEWFLDQWNTA
ncbi:MAG: phospholipase D-like domain-containing protein, partial [Candidatus Caldarchaeum sp.]